MKMKLTKRKGKIGYLYENKFGQWEKQLLLIEYNLYNSDLYTFKKGTKNGLHININKL